MTMSPLKITGKGFSANRTAVLATALALLLYPLVISSSPTASAVSGSWTQTTAEDFAGGSGTNVDVESSPGSVKMEASLSTWIESSYNPGLRQGPPGSWDGSGLMGPVVIKDGDYYKMWYAGDDTGAGSYRIGYSISLDGVNWTKPLLGIVNHDGSTANNIVMDLGASNSSESTALIPGTIILENATFRLWYSCMGTSWALCYATSTDGFHWQRHLNNPILNVSAPSLGIVGPTIYRSGSGFGMHFSEIDEHGHYIHRVANSPDGLSWKVMRAPFPPDMGDAGSWYDGGIIPGSYERVNGGWRLWYSGIHGSAQSIGVKGSVNGTGTVNPLLNPVLRPGVTGSWDSETLSRPCVLRDGAGYRMWFAGFDGVRWGIGTAASAFGERMAPPKTNPVMSPGHLDSWDGGGIFRPSITYRDGTYYMWYTGSRSANGSGELAIGLATSRDEVRWVKHSWQPVFEKSASGWDSAWVGFASVIWDNSSRLFRMWYTGSDNTSVRIGLATSIDGVFWQRNASNPVTFDGDLSWLDVNAMSCPWVWDANTYYAMYSATRVGGNSYLARTYSWDGGMTWTQLESAPFLSPRPGTWESVSVSCPTLLRNETGKLQWLYYEGSDQASLPGFGDIGVLVSSDYGSTFSRLQDPVLEAAKSWDAKGIGGPTVIGVSSHRRLYYHGGDGSVTGIGTAISYDGLKWASIFVTPAVSKSSTTTIGSLGASYPLLVNYTKAMPSWFMLFSYDNNGTSDIGYWQAPGYGGWEFGGPVEIGEGSPSGWDSMGKKPLAMIEAGAMYHLWYSGLDSSGFWSIGHASGVTPINLQGDPSNPAIEAGPPGTWDCEGVDGASVVHPGLAHPYEMWYSGFDGATWRIGFAYSDDGTNWTKSGSNPILYPSTGFAWDSASVYRPSVVVEGGIYHMLYSGYDGSIWSLGQAFSRDGISWVKSRLSPILGGSTSSGSPIDTRDSSLQMTDSAYRVWFSSSSGNTSTIAFSESTYLSVGSLVSAPVDSGARITTWTQVSLTKQIRSSADVSIAVRADDIMNQSTGWSGDSWSESFTPQGVRGRMLQFKLSFYSFTGEDTAVVDDVGGDFELDHGPVGIPLSPAENSCVGSSRPRFNWTFADAEGDDPMVVIIQVAEDENFTRLRFSREYPQIKPPVWSPSLLSDGVWYWRIQGWDSGAVGPWSPPVRFCVDTVPPFTKMNVVGPHTSVSPTYVSGTTQIWLNLTDSGCGRGTTYVKIDGLNWITVSQPLTLSPGDHSVDFYSVDDAGNYENPRTETFYVDVTAPNTTLVAGGPQALRNGVLYVGRETMLLLKSVDTESGTGVVQYSVDTLGGWTDDSVVMPLTPGLHTLYYRSLDRVGNADVTRSQAVFVDPEPPATSIRIVGAQVPGSPLFVTPATQFNLTSTDAGVGTGGIYYRLDSETIPRIYTGDFSIGSEGYHVLKYYSSDILNNTEMERSLILHVDGQGPQTYVSPLGPSYVTAMETYVRASTVILLAGSDNGSGLQAMYYSLNGGPWTPYSIPFDLPVMGLNTLSFYGVDMLGAIETVNVVNIRVDEDPPSSQMQLTGTVAQSGGRTYVDDGTTVSVQAYDAGAGVLLVRYRLDGGSWSVYGSPFPLHGYGNHTVEFQAIDNLGIEETPRTYHVVVDAQSPTAEAGRDLALFAPADIFLDATASTDDTTITSFDWTAQWNGSVVLTSARGTVRLQDPGFYTFVLRVRDPLGRESTDLLNVRLMRNPDSDGDLLPDIWEMTRFGNLTYGPSDDPDGDGVSNLEEYRRQKEIDTGGGEEIELQDDSDQVAGLFWLFILVLLGVLIGVVVLQWIKNRELKKKLGDKEAMMSVRPDKGDMDDSPDRSSQR